MALQVLILILSLNIIITNGFRLEEKYPNFRSQLDSLEEKWLAKSVLPSYIQDFIKSHGIKNSSETLQEDDTFLGRLLNGVSSEICKTHVAEWYARIDLKHLGDIAKDKNKWVLQMVDAWGKLPEGILAGHVNSYGDFHECIQIKVEGDDLEILNEKYPRNGDYSNLEGQYCTSYILPYEVAMSLTPIPVGDYEPPAMQHHTVNGRENEIQEAVSLEDFIKMMFGSTPIFMPMIPSVGVCMPNSCSATDIQQILVNGLYMQYTLFNPNTDLTVLPWPATVFCRDGHKEPLSAGSIVVIVILVILVTLALVAGVIDYWQTNHSSKDTSASSSPKHQSLAIQYLMAFSLYTNIRKWLSTRKSPDDLGCLHGIRFFSTAWVVLGHTYSMYIQGLQWNLVDVTNIYKHWSELMVINGTFSVDTFFLMSGMLATYSILKMLDKTKGRFNIILFYIHRYVRITPTYAIIIAIAATLMHYVGNGPTWYIMDMSEENCRKNWWTNLLYVNNLVNGGEMCNGESWYLANDMQFFILSPLIVYPLWKWDVMGGLLLTIYTILSCIAPVLVVRYAENVPPAMVLTNINRIGPNPRRIYHRPYTRISTFLVGVWLGWIIHKTRGRRLNLSPLIVAAGWLISTGTALAVIFGIFPWFNPNNEIPKVGGYFYAGLGRFSFAVAVAWVIFACIKGYGGIVNKFLSWSVFMPLGRLCFCVYLISSHVQSVFHLRLAVPIKWDTYTTVNIYFAHMVMSYLLGFVATLLFESPFITLQKLIFEGGQGRRKNEVKNENQNGSLKVKTENTNQLEKSDEKTNIE